MNHHQPISKNDAFNQSSRLMFPIISCTLLLHEWDISKINRLYIKQPSVPNSVSSSEHIYLKPAAHNVSYQSKQYTLLIYQVNYDESFSLCTRIENISQPPLQLGMAMLLILPIECGLKWNMLLPDLKPSHSVHLPDSQTCTEPRGRLRTSKVNEALDESSRGPWMT